LLARQLKLRATQSKTSLRRLHFQSAQADFAVCCPQFQLPGFKLQGHMITAEERAQFLERGYLIVPNVVQGDHLRELQNAFDAVWEAEAPGVNQHKLLKYKPFLDLIEHPPILDRHRAIFGAQTQLLQYDLLRQGPRSNAASRSWHRDFTFPGERPLSINTLLFVDDIGDEQGPTAVVPGTHRGEALPPADKSNQPLPGEVLAPVKAGSAVFINSAIWHSGGRNNSDGLRRGIYLYYGYWWLKRYESQQQLPWQALENASDERLALLGVRMPDNDVHQYDPAR